MEPLAFARQDAATMQAAADAFHALVSKRRSVRQFSADPVPEQIITTCIRAAATVPSGANLQPWHFVAVQDPALKSRIRAASEAEERRFYASRAPQAWLDVLKPFGTDAIKPYLERAPWLIAVFSVNAYETADGERQPTYYPKESVGIATGVLITALHQAGLATLTHTPSPMNFLNDLLDRPATEKPFLLLVVGYPEAGARVPVVSKKSFAEIATVI